MIEFGEVLTLLIASLMVAYLVANWRRIRENTTLRPLLGPFLVFVGGWIATVVEDVFWQGVPLEFVVLGRAPAEAVSGGPVTLIFHLVEHASYTVAAAWLLWVIWHTVRARREAPA